MKSQNNRRAAAIALTIGLTLALASSTGSLLISFAIVLPIGIAIAQNSESH